METRDVVKCIVCLQPATVFIGHLLEFKGQHIDNSVGAGFCDKHQDTYCPNNFREEGCYGLWKRKYGVQIREILRGGFDGTGK